MPNKKILLHIGRHKTGTSTLQRFFVRNKYIFKSLGFLYPGACLEKGYGHHSLANYLNDPVANISFQLAAEAIKEEINSAVESIVIISSEAFQNVDPQKVKDFFYGYDVSIIVYLREQCGYLASAYAQRIQASNEAISLERYNRQFFSKLADYRHFVEKWEESFPGKLRVSVFDREQMVGGDITLDFCEKHLGINNDVLVEKFSLEEDDFNPTVSEKALLLKRRLNNFLPLDFPEKEDVYNYLSDLEMHNSLDKFSLSEECVSELVEKYSESNDWLVERYLKEGQKLIFKPVVAKSQSKVTLSEFSDFLNKLLLKFPSLGAYQEEVSLDVFDKELSTLEKKVLKYRELADSREKEALSWHNECARREKAWRDEVSRREELWMDAYKKLEGEVDLYKQRLILISDRLNYLESTLIYRIANRLKVMAHKIGLLKS